jgi:alpha-glucosidase
LIRDIVKSKEFRELLSKKYLLMDNEGNLEITFEKSRKPLLIHWWNGYSACLDLSNPGAKEWLLAKLHKLQRLYGVDGFKLDAGDPYFYDSPHLLSSKNISPNDHCEQWAKIGLQFPLNEYRAMWKMGGQPLVQRLADKSHSWDDLEKLIPNTIVQQLMGHTFTCPDMIGGGEFTSFLPGKIINQKLIVRSAQIHALMPMMQFSVAPWRILDSVHLRAVLDAVKLRQKMLPEIMHILRNSAQTGEPVIRSLAYNFPNGNYENVNDEFMLGQNILVAPMVTDMDTRDIILPEGNWNYNNKKWKGGKKYSIKVALNEIPVFVRME